MVDTTVTTARIRSNLSLRSTADAVEAKFRIQPHARPIKVEERVIGFRIGSRAALRIWGIWGPRADRRLPAIIFADISEANVGILVDLDFRSDEGLCAVRLPIVERMYREKFQRLIEELRIAVSSGTAAGSTDNS